MWWNTKVLRQSMWGAWWEAEMKVAFTNLKHTVSVTKWYGEYTTDRMYRSIGNDEQPAWQWTTKCKVRANWLHSYWGVAWEYKAQECNISCGCKAHPESLSWVWAAGQMNGPSCGGCMYFWMAAMYTHGIQPLTCRWSRAAEMKWSERGGTGWGSCGDAKAFYNSTNIPAPGFWQREYRGLTLRQQDQPCDAQMGWGEVSISSTKATLRVACCWTSRASRLSAHAPLLQQPLFFSNPFSLPLSLSGRSPTGGAHDVNNMATQTSSQRLCRTSHKLTSGWSVNGRPSSALLLCGTHNLFHIFVS